MLNQNKNQKKQRRTRTMLNNLVLMGRITKDPTSKKIGETTIVNFDIAVDNIRKEADGTRGTSFFSVVCFKTIAESVEKHLHKGSKVAVVGSIQQRNFIRKDGSKGSVYEVIANSVEFLDQKPSETPEADGEESQPQEEQPKFDPYTGKPLKPETKK